jgi:hypothetical protein
MAGRRVIFSHEFDECAKRLGDPRLVDDAVAPIVDALYSDPSAFQVIATDWVRCRYAVTRATAHLPPLIVIFTIEENGDVIIGDIEEAERY